MKAVFLKFVQCVAGNLIQARQFRHEDFTCESCCEQHLLLEAEECVIVKETVGRHDSAPGVTIKTEPGQPAAIQVTSFCQQVKRIAAAVRRSSGISHDGSSMGRIINEMEYVPLVRISFARAPHHKCTGQPAAYHRHQQHLLQLHLG